MEEKEIILNDKKFFYRTRGEGPAVILLHGFGEEGWIWSNQYKALNGFQLIIPDLPGSGQSEMIDDMSMEGLAKWLKELSPLLTSPGGGRTQAQSSPVQDSLQSSEEVSAGEFYLEADPINYTILKNFVSQHRKFSTQAEDFLWQQLCGDKLDGFSFRRQHIIGNFITDFVCLAKKLVIEVDGLIHQLPENKISDEERTAWLGMKGYTVMRFSNEEILFDSQNTLNRIKQKLHELSFAKKKNYARKTTGNREKNNDLTTSRASAADPFPVGGSRMGAGQITLIGHSMGGYITLAFAEKYPALLNGFGLFHSTAYADSEEKKETRKKGIEFIKKNGAFAFLKTSIPNLYSPVTKKLNPQLIAYQIERSHKFSGAALVNYYRSMMQRPDRTEILKNSRLPVLFILGKYDNAVPLKDGLEQCSLPDLAYIHVLENAGHMGMREEPAESNQILRNYLKNLHHQTQ